MCILNFTVKKKAYTIGINSLMYIYLFRKNVHLTGLTVWISVVNFVLTLVNSEITGVSMEIATRGLSVVIITSGLGRDRR